VVVTDKPVCIVMSIMSSTAFVLLQVHSGENILLFFTDTLAILSGQHSICMLLSNTLLSLVFVNTDSGEVVSANNVSNLKKCKPI
jgi:hypothetical protein